MPPWSEGSTDIAKKLESGGEWGMVARSGGQVSEFAHPASNVEPGGGSCSSERTPRGWTRKAG
jgi:hypothetical protein